MMSLSTQFSMLQRFSFPLSTNSQAPGFRHGGGGDFARNLDKNRNVAIAA